MTAVMANAYPRKNFFVQMFTKDISLEDCVLDLIDNSVDGLVRSRGLRLSEIAAAIWGKQKKHVSAASLPVVAVSLSESGFEIKDNCGGIDRDYAIQEAFNFGHAPGSPTGYLGVYGVGLKRALFKIGDYFVVTSKTIENGFRCELDVKEWLKKDQSADDWKIPLTKESGAATVTSAGTEIKVVRLHEEVKMRVSSGTIEASLCHAIATTYCFFLERYVRITVNGRKVEPLAIPTAKPAQGSVSFEHLSEGGVQVRVLATVASPDEAGRYDQERAGWYVVCNGRAVLSADKGEITGWGVPPMPSYQPKHRCFIGVVFFEAKDPLLLPWTTTKRSLDRESSIYLRVRNRMALAARPVLSFVNKLYPSDVDVTASDREITSRSKEATPAELASAKNVLFSVPARPTARKTTTRVQYDAKNSDLEKVRTHLRKPSFGANRIGEHTFKYFLQQEGLG